MTSNPTLEQLQLLGYQDGEMVFYRAIEKQAWKFSSKFPTIPFELENLSNCGSNVYFVVNGCGQSDKEVDTCKAIFYEHDDLPKEDQIYLWQRLELPEPTFQVDTGGKSIHSYWVFDLPIDVSLWRSLQTDLLNFSDADRTIKNPSRVMRLAGYKHQKTGEISSIVSKGGKRYTFDEIRSIVPVTPAVVKEQKQKREGGKLKSTPTTNTSTPVLRTTSPSNLAIPLEFCLAHSSRDLLHGVSEGGRNDSGAKLSRDLIGTEHFLRTENISYTGDARSLFDDFCYRCSPPIDDSESQTIWGSAETDFPEPSCPPDAIENILNAFYRQNDPNYVPPQEDRKVGFYSNRFEGLVSVYLGKNDDGEITKLTQVIGSHIEAVAYCQSPDGTGAGILIELETQRKKIRRVLIPRETLTGDGLEALKFLADLGYFFRRKQRGLLLDYLFGLGSDVSKSYTIADKTGWVNGSFLTPAKTYGDGDLRFRDPEPDNSMTEMKGSLDSWKSEVAAKCEGNSRLIFSLGTAFAAALLEPTQIESGGFHLVGTTSIGKTTALNVAASVAGLKHIPNWRSTSNALEGKASEFNHGLLPLDEIGQADPQTVGASAYMLGNGQGKARMTKHLTNTKPKTWNLLFLSTGEVSMIDYLRQAKIPAKGGMEARMPSIRADAGKGLGVFENIGGYDTSKAFVDALETAISKYQGTALDDYLTQLVELRGADVKEFDKKLRDRVHSIARLLSYQYSDTAIGRVAVRFALVQVGLELAHSFGLLPFPLKQCRWAVLQNFDDWVGSRGGEGSIEIKEACNKIEFLFESSQHGDRIYEIGINNPLVKNLLAYKVYDVLTQTLEYLVPVTVFNKELAEGVDRSQLIAKLKELGYLKVSTENDRNTVKRRILGKQRSFFAFRDFWVESDEEKIPQTTNELDGTKKAREQREQREHPIETSSDRAFEVFREQREQQNSNGNSGNSNGNSSSNGNGNNGNNNTPVPVVPVAKNSTEQERNNLEPSQGDSLKGAVPVFPLFPCKKQPLDIKNKNNTVFEVGDRVNHDSLKLNGTIKSTRTKTTPSGSTFIQYLIDFGFDESWAEPKMISKVQETDTDILTEF